MIEEYAIVTKSAGTLATLEIERRTACGLCGQKRGCGNATWGKMLGHDSHDFTAENQINAQVGDSVVVGIDEQAVLSSALFLYIVPLLGLLIGTVAADYLFKNQFYVIIGALLGLVLGFLWVKGHLIGRDKSGVAFSKKYQAAILRLAKDEAKG
ncbi:SoxR reducing system RseC family protein [Methylotenera sp.]|uniref:SoxR reducing system RseC family protein n=1 Tax=Methylotenera sp. TaxID=2051956 RepID=UPI0024880F40|nr:SoxR reducing system RseC family protein [Methylotenera sp.]MDI1297955.1 SoxR reducing system RseC family protein [Methylotenera sp.]